MVLSLGIGPPFVNPGVCPSGQAVAEHRLIPSRARPIWSSFGLGSLLVVMLVLVLFALVVCPYLSHPLSLLSFRIFSDWVEFCEPLFLLLKEGVVHLFVV